MATDPDALIEAIVRVAARWQDPDDPERADVEARTLEADNTFTPEALAYAVNQQMALMTASALRSWIGGRRASRPLDVAVIHPGNVPMADLHDWLSVVLAGHRYVGVPSSRSPFLVRAFAAAVSREGGTAVGDFTDFPSALARSGAVIASGTTETMARVGEACAEAGIPPERRLLRGHRYGVAVIGSGTHADDLEPLAEDMLLHEGRGCRNVALVWAPAGESPDPLLEAMAAFRGVFPAHPRTPASLKMRQAMLHAVDVPHAYGDDLSFLLSKGAPEAQEPAHVRWTEYDDLETVDAWLRRHAGEIQILAASERIQARLQAPVARCAPGDTQRPPLDLRLDGIDPIDVLVGWSA